MNLQFELWGAMASQSIAEESFWRLSLQFGEVNISYPPLPSKSALPMAMTSIINRNITKHRSGVKIVRRSWNITSFMVINNIFYKFRQEFL